jgi:hypothetical protein
MRKIKLFAVAAPLILAGVGMGRLGPQASVAAPVGVRIDPLQIMMNAKDLPTERYHDLSSASWSCYCNSINGEIPCLACTCCPIWA